MAVLFISCAFGVSVRLPSIILGMKDPRSTLDTAVIHTFQQGL
jgi:hypothetical protein